MNRLSWIDNGLLHEVFVHDLHFINNQVVVTFYIPFHGELGENVVWIVLDSLLSSSLGQANYALKKRRNIKFFVF